jgi:hypothetical protein
MSSNYLPEIVTTAFERVGLQPPDPEHVDRVGYSAVESLIIEREKARRERLTDTDG